MERDFTVPFSVVIGTLCLSVNVFYDNHYMPTKLWTLIILATIAAKVITKRQAVHVLLALEALFGVIILNNFVEKEGPESIRSAIYSVEAMLRRFLFVFDLMFLALFAYIMVISGVKLPIIDDIRRYLWYRRILGGAKKIRPDDATERCPICLAPLIDATCLKLQCGHYYHGECIKRWVDVCAPNPNCPLCKCSF